MVKLKRILLVDDDNINNFINQRLIKKLNIAEEVNVAVNGEEAIKVIKNTCDHECPDLILLDINMPVMDGFEFLEEYKKLPIANKDKVVIVMLTTSTNQNDMGRSKNIPIRGFLNKPLTEDKLTKIMKDYFTSAVN